MEEVITTTTTTVTVKKKPTRRTKKRARESDDDSKAGAPSAKLQRLSKSIDQMTKDELKDEIWRLDPDLSLSQKRKHMLISILTELLAKPAKDVDEMTGQEVINELKNLREYKGRSSWNKKELLAYLKHLRSRDVYRETNNLKDDDKKVSAVEFGDMPLFEIHLRYGFKTSEKNRMKMYVQLEDIWRSGAEKAKREEQEKKEKEEQEIREREEREQKEKEKKEREKKERRKRLVQPIIDYFWVTGSDGQYSSKRSDSMNGVMDMLFLTDLNGPDRSAVHLFCRSKGLFAKTLNSSWVCITKKRNEKAAKRLSVDTDDESS